MNSRRYYRSVVCALLLALPLVLSLPVYQSVRQQELKQDISRTYGEITRRYDQASSTAAQLEQETFFAQQYAPNQPLLAAAQGGEHGR